ncbi:CLUMA_CG007415, isoform A [Clunio marinus]|uniref:CLUMA_CG007415, isoform A n=1 Tax=Clunio marinus TaxID=568069 RepID=A0A1J1I0M7_9DIPT|nr:CLUMA_CG007415, isoform A [Clunio marinus]
MKMLIKFVLCCVFLQFRCSFAAISILKAETSGNLTIPKYISFLVNENNKQDQTHNYDVVLIRLELQHQNDTFENIREELLKVNRDNPILTFDLFDESQPKVQFPQIYAASFIIIVTDLTDSALFYQKLSVEFYNKTFSDSTKFGLITSKKSSKSMKQFFTILDYLGFINLIILRDDDDHQIKIYTFNKFGKIIYAISSEDRWNFPVVFPDRLKNLNGYQFPMLFIEEYSRCTIVNDEIDGINFRVLKMFMNKYNGAMSLTASVNPADPQISIKIQNYFSKNLAGISLSTSVKLSDWKKWIYTYDENGYCALIPRPPRLTFLHFILTPFDGLSWTFMIISIVVCSIFWKLLTRSYNYLKSNSPFFFIFGVIANFLGQSIPFRNSRRIQKLLLQLCVLMTFIMGNAYQSLIIASMSTSRDGRKFNTWQEMFSSDLTYEVGEIFYVSLKESGDFPDVINRMNVAREIQFEKLSLQNVAIILRCNDIQTEIDYNKDVDVMKHFYLLPGKLTPFIEKFALAPSNPLLGILQTNFNYIFESGIRQYLERYFQGLRKKNVDDITKFIINEDYLLTMNDVYGIFLILVGGYVVSFFVFICELIWRHLKKIANSKIRANQERKI